MWPHRRQPTRLPCPQDSPGKNTGMGCHFLLQCMKVKSESEVVQSCPTLSDPMDWSPPGCSVHGIFQARVLEWGAIAFSVQRTSILLRRNSRKLVLFLAAFLSLSLSCLCLSISIQLFLWGHREKMVIHHPRREVTPETNPDTPWSWTSSLQKCEEKISFA